jgi:hypothetical protein
LIVKRHRAAPRRGTTWSLGAQDRARLRALLDRADVDGLLAWYRSVSPPVGDLSHIYVALRTPGLMYSDGTRALDAALDVLKDLADGR